MKEKKKEKKKRKQLPQKETDRKSNEMSQSGPGRSRTSKAMLIDDLASNTRRRIQWATGPANLAKEHTFWCSFTPVFLWVFIEYL